MKRQRFMARQSGGSAQGAGGGRSRPPALGQDFAQPAFAAPAAPSSPLSQLVARGYPQEEQRGSAHQPYGERPSSGSNQARGPNPGSRGSQQGQQAYGQQGQQGQAYGSGGGGGFDAAVAGQWQGNVQQTRHDQQNRHDPNVAGPTHHSGGQRISQAPGGSSNIDLGWPQNANAQQPPRMPGSTPTGSGVGGQRQQAYDSDARSAGGSRGANDKFASPWGRDDEGSYVPSRQPQGRRETCPFGTEAPAAAPPPRQRDPGPFAYDDQPAAQPSRRPPRNSAAVAYDAPAPVVQYSRGTPKQREACPFAFDAPAPEQRQPRQREACPFAYDDPSKQQRAAPQAAVRSGSRGRSDMEGGQPAGFGCEAPRGRRPPGGASQVVFG